jgi:hypothetical protein
MLTHGCIKEIGFENLTAFQQNRIRRAVCLMIDHFAEEGAAGTDFASYAMPEIRVTRHRRKEKPWEIVGCGMWAWFVLMSTGLMRGVL